MTPAPQPPDETERLQALLRLGVLDTPREDQVDAVARAAALVCGVPIALVSLVDRERQWFKACIGLSGVESTPRDAAFCAHAICESGTLIVPDAREDPRFADNPLVTGPPFIRFYAGAPLRVSSGQSIGTLCVIDTEPGELTSAQVEALEVLRDRAVSLLEAREVSEKTRRVLLGWDLAENVNDLIQSVDASERILYVNRAWRETLGYSRLEASQLTLSDLVAPDVKGAFDAARGRVLAGEDVGEIETSFVTKGGAQVEVAGTLNLRPGDPPATRGTFRDVSEARRGERELAGFFSLSLDLLAVLDSRGRFVRFNPAWETQLGHRPQDLQGRPLTTLIHPGDREVCERALGRAGQGPQRFECRSRTMGGENRRLVWNVRQSRSGHFYAVARDVTDERLRTARLEAVLRGSHHGILTLDRAGKIESANRAARLMVRAFSDELTGNTLQSLLEAPETLVLPREPLEPSLAQDLPAQDLCVRRFDGTRFPAEVALREVEVGGQGLLICFMSDLTERKAVERIKDELLSTVSHELRTPLTAIRGALGLLAGGVLGELPAEAQEVSAIALESAERLQRLVNDLLDLESMRAGRFDLERRPARLGPLVETACRGIQVLAEERGVEVERLAPEPDLEVSLDEARVIQVLTNLLGNALKFSPPGGRVLVSWTRDGEQLVVTVEDEGPGIPAGKEGVIFEPFEQLDHTDSRSRLAGTGLGLAICRQIVEAHGGEIGVARRPSGGSRFWFEIPGAGPTVD